MKDGQRPLPIPHKCIFITLHQPIVVFPATSPSPVCYQRICDPAPLLISFVRSTASFRCFPFPSALWFNEATKPSRSPACQELHPQKSCTEADFPCATPCSTQLSASARPLFVFASIQPAGKSQTQRPAELDTSSPGTQRLTWPPTRPVKRRTNLSP